jgi:hypothetical protein
MFMVSSPLRRDKVLRADPPCLDLRELCRGVYYLDDDPAAGPSGGGPWPAALVGRRGVIYSFDEDRLAVEVRHDRVALQVAAALGGLLPHQCGDGFFYYLFRPDQLGVVAAVVQVPKVRRLSPAARGRLTQIRGGTRNGRPLNGCSLNGAQGGAEKGGDPS